MTEGRERDPASTRFVILAAPRTGSNLLCTLLNGHPEVLCHHELLNPAGIFYALDLRGGDFDCGTLEERDREPVAFIERVLSRDGGNACVGWKMTRGQDATALDHILEDTSTRKIVLRRRNRVRTFVSEKIAERTGRWEMYAEEEVAPQPVGVSVTRRELAEHAALNDQFYDSVLGTLRSAGQVPLEIEYEMLFAVTTQRRMLGFLNVDPADAPLSPSSVRQNPWPLRRLVANYDELELELRGSNFHEELVG